MADNMVEPVDQDADPARFHSTADFGAALTALKQRAGVSLRQLSSASGLGFSTINGYCRGRHLPQSGVGEQFRSLLEALGITADGEQEAWLVAAARLRRAKAADKVVANPYPGLQPYDVGGDRFFYGRDRLIEDLVGMVGMVAGDQPARGPVVVVGPSGAGKSSVLRAGLMPALTADWDSVLLTPGESPIQKLVHALAAVTKCPADALLTLPDGNDVDLSDLCGPGQRPLLVVVDQLEEIFAPNVDEAERGRFVAAVTSLAAGEKGSRPVAVVLGLRADFYDRALRLQLLADPLRDAQVLVPAMNRQQLRKVITAPAQDVGKSVDGAVVERILGDIAPRDAGRSAAAHEPGALPLLAHALHEAFALSAGANSVTLEHYERTGGVIGAIARTADAVYEQLSVRQQQLARSLLLSMVHVEDGTAVDTRRRLNIDAVTAAQADAELDDLAEVLDSFITHRLLTADAESVEISHEALLVHWPRLREWIDDARDQLRVHQRVADGTRSWLAHNRDAGELARGARLDAMRTLLDHGSDEGPLLSADERDFVAVSIRAQRSQHRRLRMLAIAMTILALAATAFAGMFAVTRQQAATARDEALSRQMAVTARQLAVDDPAAAVQLAIAGYRIVPTVEARSAMLDLASGGYPSRYPPVGLGLPSAASAHFGERFAVSYSEDAVVQIYEVAQSSLVPAGEVEIDSGGLDPGEAHSVALSPDGNLLAVRESANGVALWNVADPKQPARLGSVISPRGVHDLAISPEGGELAVVGPGAKDVYRWNISDPAAPKKGPHVSASGKLRSLAYSPRGTMLAVGTDDATVELWEVAGRPERVADIPVGGGRVAAVAFSPDGSMLTAGTAFGRTVSVWDIADRGRPEQLEIADPQFDSWVNRTTFSPDGSLLLAATSESVVRVWDTRTWEAVADLAHPNPVGWVGFASPHVAVTNVNDGTIWSWDLRTTVPPRMPGRAWRTSFASNTGQLAVFAEGEAALWPDADSGVLGTPSHVVADRRGEQSVGDGDVTADGSLLVQSYNGDGTVAVFDASGSSEPQRLSEFRGDTAGIVQSLALSPDGRLVATGGNDAIVRVHDISDPRHPKGVAELKQTARLLGVRWQPQGDLLVAASADGTVTIYDVSDPADAKRVAVLDAFEREVHLAEFSPDGELLAAGGLDGLIRIWDVSDPAHPVALGGPISGPVNVVPKLAFHPDGTKLAATDSKGSVWLFDISDPGRPVRHATLNPDIGQLNSLAFHPGGEFLAVTSVPGVVRLWQLDEEQVISRVCANVGEPITEQQWRTHLADVEYQRPC